VLKAGRDLGFVTLDAARVRIGKSHLHRLAVMEKTFSRRGGAGGVRLVRCRFLACGVGTVGQGSTATPRGYRGVEDSRNCTF